MFAKFIKIFFTIIFLFLNFFTISFAKNDKAYVEHEKLSLELISSVKSINNKSNLYLGLYFKLDPGWKIYWKYPGKARYPPDIDWKDSNNIKNLEILWPKPKKFEILGMQSIGYSNNIILPVKVSLSKNNELVVANFNIDYLTCNKICVPYTDRLILEIPKGDGSGSKYENLINEYIEKSNYIKYSNFFSPDSILFFLLIAFIGGIILNFMPCVFPVLSLKIYNVLSNNQKSITSKIIKRNFFATVLGIIFSFFILSLITILLKNLGHNLGWGFQFQSPIFLIFMISILIIFSLSLMDIFSFDIPRFVKNYLNKIMILNKKNSEFYQNFFLGTFITLLSTPCSAPFIGTALGFAFVSPNEIIFLIFFFISLGLSSPYIILATNPGLLSFLPKPGLWMKKIKYFLSIILMITAVWLASVLLIQVNIFKDNSNDDNWIKFEQNKIDKLILENHIVFVDITADWCLTCFYNKKTVLDRKKVKNIFDKYDVIKMRGDLTKPNKEINEYINTLGRFGIPVNIIYSPSTPQGVLLSEVLTVKSLLSTFERVKND